MQLTAAGLLGHYGQRARKTAEALLTHNAYSLVGSDLHRTDQPRRLSQLYQAIVELVGEGAASILVRENPRRVLQGDPLIWREVLPFSNVRKGFFARFARS
jgi:protein-tyrosine phosphatase